MAKRPKTRTFSPNHPLSEDSHIGVELPNSAKASVARKQINSEEALAEINNELQSLGELPTLDSSSSSQEDLTKQVSALAKHQSGTDFNIVHDGETYHCSIETIPFERIEEVTEVESANERIQEWLTPIALSEMIESIREHGQLYPAIAHRVDGKIKVVDGSSRRMSCIHGGLSFTTLVSDKVFPSSLIQKLTVNANVHRSISILERAIKWAQYITEHKARQSAAAKVFGVNEGTMSTGLLSIEIPRRLLNLFPSPADIGKSTIRSLHKTLCSHSIDEINPVIDAFSKKITEHDFTSSTPTECNKQALQVFYQEYQSAFPDDDASKTFRVNTPFGSKNQGGALKIDANDNVTLSIKKPTRLLTLTAMKTLVTECLPDDKEILSIIESSLNKRK